MNYWNKFRLHFCYCLIFIFTFSFISRSQPGKDGTAVISATGQVVNRYYPVAANIAAGSNSILLAPTFTNSLCHGDLLMIYQAQGASISTINSAVYGNIT